MLFLSAASKVIKWSPLYSEYRLAPPPPEPDHSLNSRHDAKAVKRQNILVPNHVLSSYICMSMLSASTSRSINAMPLVRTKNAKALLRWSRKAILPT